LIELRNEFFPVTRSIFLPNRLTREASSVIIPFLKKIFGKREN